MGLKDAAGYGVTKVAPTPATLPPLGKTVWSQGVHRVATRSSGLVTGAQTTTALDWWDSHVIEEPVWSTDLRTLQEQREEYCTQVWNAAMDYMDANTPAPTLLIDRSRAANPYDSTPDADPLG